MSTLIDEGVDTDTITVLDFDYAIPCDMNKFSETVPNCENVAEWKITLSCCGTNLFLCQEHLDSILEAMARDDVIFTHPKPYGCGNEMVKPIAAAEKL